MERFEQGKTYQTRSICDHDCIVAVRVVSRTAKTIKTDEGKTLRIAVWHDGSAEYVKPWGSYSMAPMVKASQVAV